MIERDVVVAGAGVIGLSVALRCAELGASVIVVDDAPGGGASWAAAGMLAPVTEAHPGEEQLLRLNVAAAAVYEDWVRHVEQASGRLVGYRRTGTLVVARDRDEAEVLGDLFELQTSLGLDVARLPSSECRTIEPRLSPRIRGGLLVRGDHSVDNRLLVTALLEACTRAGVAFERQRVAAVHGGTAVDGVALSDGRHVPVRNVVVAAGARSGQIRMPKTTSSPPVRPVKGQLVHLRTRDVRSLPSLTLRGIHVYAVPREDGRLVVGATMEERGYDETITAGAVYELVRDVYEIFPDVAEFELIETTAGLRPATPDNAPLLGPDTLDGLFYATGHFRNGVLLAPITGEQVATAVVKGEVNDAIAAFSPRRFGGPERLAS